MYYVLFNLLAAAVNAVVLVYCTVLVLRTEKIGFAILAFASFTFAYSSIVHFALELSVEMDIYLFGREVMKSLRLIHKIVEPLGLISYLTGIILLGKSFTNVQNSRLVERES